MKCVNCGCVMSWQNVFDFEDYGIIDEDGIVSVYYCGECGTLSENYIPVGGTEDEICED